ncbi:hypothetical protein LB565_04270 [Mesorhizobium sp. CA14]|uniref:hypothetical protein n=1 Tax=Mesorhizobium sp. CA14 TaxID=2876642 RepID=UPI001CCDFF91|nr:hypothetical protein [Mesorhizobium sp. CA14]MBZ9847203.1 hypothetical protein [Mesorhizobium sp. CA14]
MHYFSSRSACPNHAKLATMTKEAAADWAASASTECSEVSRLAEMETFFNLTRAETNALHRAAVDARVAARFAN